MHQLFFRKLLFTKPEEVDGQVGAVLAELHRLLETSPTNAHEMKSMLYSLIEASFARA